MIQPGGITLLKAGYLVRPGCAFGLLPRCCPSATLPRFFASSIREHGYHAQMGIFGAHYAYTVLEDYGYTDLLMKSVTAREAPSFADQISRGATSLWELWSGVAGPIITTTAAAWPRGSTRGWAALHPSRPGMARSGSGHAFRVPMTTPGRCPQDPATPVAADRSPTCRWTSKQSVEWSLASGGAIPAVHSSYLYRSRPTLKQKFGAPTPRAMLKHRRNSTLCWCP